MKTRMKALFVISIFLIAAATPLITYAKQDEVELTIIELKANGKGGGNVIPPTDNSEANPDYSLLRFRWYTTANYWVNPTNSYQFANAEVVSTVQTAANTWDIKTPATVFAYKGTTSLRALTRDSYNVVDWGTYSSANVIAVTYIWSSGGRIIETDLRMNTNWGWSLSGENGKMDTQNILTHEFGHWIGLNDLYKNSDYWLTMYGYSNYGVTYQRSLGQGDINGLQAVCGS